MAQAQNETFGKNKVQYNDDQYDWWIYETNNFVNYWYGKSRNVAQFIIEIEEDECLQVQQLFEYHLKDKIEIYIYSDLSDLAQNNLDVDLPVDPKNWNNQPKVIDQKILLYFDGDHQHLHTMLRKGIIQVYFNSMFSGTNLQDVVQKIISFRLPEWFQNGLIEYVSQGWSSDDEYEFNSTWKQNKFNSFAKKYPVLAGKSFWHYLHTNYRKSSISNWLYLIRINKDIEKSASLVFSQSLQVLQSEWRAYYVREQKTFENNQQAKQTKLRLKPEEELLSVMEDNTEGNYILKTTQNGKWRFRKLNTNTNKLTTYFRKGIRNKIYFPDVNYPLIYQASQNDLGYIVYEKRNRVYLKIIDKKQHRSENIKLPEDIYRVYSMLTISPTEFLFSASNNGFSDVFYFNARSRQYKKLSDDIFDDQELQLIENTKDQLIIYFRSNRPNDSLKITKLDSLLPMGNYKLYQLHFNKIQQNSKISAINLPLQESIVQYQYIGNNKFFLFSNNYGERKLYCIENKMPIWYSSLENISTMHYDPNRQEFIVFHPAKKKNIIKYEKIPERDFISNKAKPFNIENIINIALDSINQNRENNISAKKLFAPFQTKFGKSAIPQKINVFEKSYIEKKSEQTNSTIHLFRNTFDRKAQQFNSNLAIAYRKRFQMTELGMNLNNDILFGGLNTYSGYRSNYNNVPLGILFKVVSTEIFNTIGIEAGLRIPTNFVGNEAYLLLQNRKRRMDYILGLYRRHDRNLIPGRTVDFKKVNNTFLLNNVLSYAINPYHSIRLNGTIRNDHEFYLVNTRSALDSAEKNIQRLGFRLEYVADHVLDIGVNMKDGLQAKFYVEASKRFQVKEVLAESKFYKGALIVYGFDVRYHYLVLRKSTISLRINYSSSIGRDRLLHHLGGTENWLLPKFSEENPISPTTNYTYESLITEIRGHAYGSRKGGSAFVSNVECRIPILQYILHENWKNSFFRNLLLLGFYDYGFTWDGAFPNYNTAQVVKYHVENSTVIVDLKYNREPSISGLGFGFRTSVLGYYIRYDHAWPILQNGFGKAVNYVSLGFDF